MVEDTIEAAREVEGDILVGTAVVHALTILVLEVEGVAREVHLRKALTRTGKALVVLTLEREGGAIHLALRLAVGQRQGIVARGREVVVGREAHGLLLHTVGVDRQVDRWLRSRLQVAPEVDHGLLQVQLAAELSVCVVELPHIVGQGGREGQLFDRGGIREHLAFVARRLTFGREEEAHDLLAIGAQDERVADLLTLCVGCHVGRLELLLEGHRNMNVALDGLDRGGFVGFPKGLVTLQVGVEVQEIKKVVIGLFHSYLGLDIWLIVSTLHRAAPTHGDSSAASSRPRSESSGPGC